MDAMACGSGHGVCIAADGDSRSDRIIQGPYIDQEEPTCFHSEHLLDGEGYSIMSEIRRRSVS